ncbi:MAG: hypothetical protein WCG45_04815 [bacterium]
MTIQKEFFEIFDKAYYEVKDGVLYLNIAEDNSVYPSVIYPNKTKEWRLFGMLNRHDGLPTVEYANGDVEYWYYGKRHRKDGTAINIIGLNMGNSLKWKSKMDYENSQELVCISGQNVCYFKMKYGLRLSALEDKFKYPTYIWDYGTKEWKSRGLQHRENGPAIEYPNGDKEWWHYGKRHRKNGPAVIYGSKHYWFENGNFIKMEINNGNQ